MNKINIIHKVPDERFDKLCQIFKPKSEKPATLDIVDIAGFNLN